MKRPVCPVRRGYSWAGFDDRIHSIRHFLTPGEVRCSMPFVPCGGFCSRRAATRSGFSRGPATQVGEVVLCVDDVLFDHQVHSDWIKCSTCHPAIFRDELGGNMIKMTDMAKGRFCGHCHGKVSFTFADCLRCHKKRRGLTLSE